MRGGAKYRDPFSFQPSHSLFLCTNHLPRPSSLDTGLWRRLVVIPFKAVIEPDAEIKNYAEHLAAEAGPAILAWCIEGAQEVAAMEFKLEQPPAVCEAIRSYRDESDWLQHFLDEKCELGDGLRQPSGELYLAYRAFAESIGEFTRKAADFTAALENAGFARGVFHGRKYFLGLQLRKDELDFLQ